MLNVSRISCGNFLSHVRSGAVIVLLVSLLSTTMPLSADPTPTLTPTPTPTVTPTPTPTTTVTTTSTSTTSTSSTPTSLTTSTSTSSSTTTTLCSDDKIQKLKDTIKAKNEQVRIMKIRFRELKLKTLQIKNNVRRYQEQLVVLSGQFQGLTGSLARVEVSLGIIGDGNDSLRGKLLVLKDKLEGLITAKEEKIAEVEQKLLDVSRRAGKELRPIFDEANKIKLDKDKLLVEIAKLVAALEKCGESCD